ncbi:thioesterase family protein [Bradyrhizobium lablabi]|uniref:acyl-CoA thioesterase n=1 Tax=Bradyrhizobium lablabi TaxID=722472 RepID=UPI001BAC6583|nr:thioesterase family protein [Bradyrhizobium lablabi]MBR1126180.1 thioesterase family protein [Bradyrhizobium lablabi]
MLTKTPHLFDDATKITAGDSRWQGQTSPDYWAFVGPFGGCTAATILRALIDHPQRAGDPLAMTVNYCAPVAEGTFDLDVRLVKANRSSQHWCVEMTQGGGDVATLATAVFAERRPSWSHAQAAYPGAKAFEETLPYTKVNVPWARQYDFRFVEGEPKFGGAPSSAPPDSYSKLWIGDQVPRRIDLLSLLSMSDAFFGRIFHAKREFVPFGTVSLTTYFHVSAEDLAAEDITRVLAVADAKIFNKSYGDQNGELWSPNGRLLATTTQIAYFKA